MKEYMRDMGQRIKQQRKKLKLTQEQTAEKLDISVKHFSEVERGLTGLSVENLIKLSDILGVSIDYIVKGEADRNRWNCVISALDGIPTEKDELVKELISVGVKLAVNKKD